LLEASEVKAMSAFICNNHHITALAVYAARNRIAGHTNAKAIGDMLHAENVNSVNHRYNETLRPDFTPSEWASFRPFSQVQIVKAAHCLAYQSCEHPGWENSDANKLLSAIIGRSGDNLPGYDAAQWQITPPVATPDPAHRAQFQTKDDDRGIDR
jgi:hypothetical protein